MGEMRDRMLRGELYIADDPENEAKFLRVQELLARFNDTAPGAFDERDTLLRRMLRHVGEGVVVRAPFRCEFGAISIGDHTAGVVAAWAPARILRKIGEADRVEVPPRPA